MKIYCLKCDEEHEAKPGHSRSFRASVNTAGDPEGVYTSNALRFATPEEADQYAFDLACRWTAVRDFRIEGCDEPVSHRIGGDNVLRSLEEVTA